jgi:hypothetical protein
MTTFTITAEQHASVLTSRLQHLDRGDTVAALALDWALTLQADAAATVTDLASVLATAQRAGLAHNNGAGGQYLLVATERQLLGFAAALQPPARASLPEPVAKDAMTEDGFPVLCKAWGESDLPAALIAYTRADVRKFIVDQWLGEDGEEADEQMARFDDPEEWEDQVDAIVWTFEIGGISFSRCYEADRAASPLGAAS